MVANLRVRKLMTAGATIIEPNGRCQAPVAADISPIAPKASETGLGI